ncbi:MAG: ATP-grasp domain-containing protein, partial [Rufibacter sp.]
DKHYLLEIEEAGFPIVPSALLKRNMPVRLDELFTRFQTHKLIIKPTVSGGAKNTFTVSPEEVEAVLPKLHELLQAEDFLAQPFMPQIQEEGEWSLLFFNGKYSHCLLKSAKAGDFRVQHFFGGTIHPQPAPAHLLPQAQKLVNQFAQGCLYARVDGVDVNGQLQLMELELIEPFLFLHTHEQALENYYQALMEMVPELGR